MKKRIIIRLNTSVFEQDKRLLTSGIDSYEGELFNLLRSRLHNAIKRPIHVQQFLYC
ncbi:hypothetical protein KFK09_011405 [Dendrobium nobile]|uniref:Uncharacterized protein n=1 Tax=Dendrobium nobile TaxID=94219 RepID=A0A8T3BCT0_DENNO|nr:hypothetical protein KFK09_011405 [Dendrobium nobile]